MISVKKFYQLRTLNRRFTMFSSLYPFYPILVSRFGSLYFLFVYFIFIFFAMTFQTSVTLKHFIIDCLSFSSLQNNFSFSYLNSNSLFQFSVVVFSLLAAIHFIHFVLPLKYHTFFFLLVFD